MAFTDLGLAEPILRALTEERYTEPTPIQAAAVPVVLTGRDLMAAEAYPRTWKEQREPLPLETSIPGVFAAGDVRAGAMNRVASAVGEGSMVVRLAHEYLALT